MNELNWMTTKEAAKRLGVSYVTMCKLVREQKIKAVKLGRSWAVTEDNLKKFLSGDTHDD